MLIFLFAQLSGSNLTDYNYTRPALYSPSLSSTSRDLGTPFFQGYGGGYSASGRLFEDVVSLGGSSPSPLPSRYSPLGTKHQPFVTFINRIRYPLSDLSSRPLSRIAVHRIRHRGNAERIDWLGSQPQLLNQLVHRESF